MGSVLGQLFAGLLASQAHNLLPKDWIATLLYLDCAEIN